MLSKRFHNLRRGAGGLSSSGMNYSQGVSQAPACPSIAINLAIEAAKSAANLLMTYPRPFSARALANVESYLNNNCPKEFASLAVTIFNDHCKGLVQAVESKREGGLICLRVLDNWSDDLLS
ncbi:MAG: hypothetical protein SFV17_08130 [Candidatus Obscuribacter sp.]|nr:hypothetical protein [Candidatus Melainabacteria bacterium]MDX1986640.1 hypothetical protein [Candidatus Obscuribacter sp.]